MDWVIKYVGSFETFLVGGAYAQRLLGCTSIGHCLYDLRSWKGWKYFCLQQNRWNMHPKTMLAYQEWSGELGIRPPLTGVSAGRLRWSKMEMGMDGGAKSSHRISRKLMMAARHTGGVPKLSSRLTLCILDVLKWRVRLRSGQRPKYSFSNFVLGGPFWRPIMSSGP